MLLRRHSSKPIAPCRRFAVRVRFIPGCTIGINTAKNYLVAKGRRAPFHVDRFRADEAETFEDADQLRDINTPERLMQSKQIGQTVQCSDGGIAGRAS